VLTRRLIAPSRPGSAPRRVLADAALPSPVVSMGHVARCAWQCFHLRRFASRERDACVRRPFLRFWQQPGAACVPAAHAFARAPRLRRYRYPV